MKKLIILSTYLLFSACTITEKPEFKGIENIDVLESTSKHFIIRADAVFLNPNDVGGKLKTDEIKVFINNNEMALVSTEAFNVPSKKEFKIPLKTSISKDSLFSNKNLSGLINSLFSKKVAVRYTGTIDYTILGFSHSYNIDKTEEIKIKY
ncbi:LEA type 2 family protein [Tamlana fucoidanivorans]|uniref:Uncharacterized protein n=1 Tax=Allotamlana fucoidanivorans TaxID=2583814 RepID=A0A5C4SI07_9FLAO|nr:LEA type 2 family protein [Tamlana fucoidanivorans]TNJ43110.1 hypothetical protein FGF67_12165 [Tamlana fucoidanivorans]